MSQGSYFAVRPGGLERLPRRLSCGSKRMREESVPQDTGTVQTRWGGGRLVAVLLPPPEYFLVLRRAAKRFSAGSTVNASIW